MSYHRKFRDRGRESMVPVSTTAFPSQAPGLRRTFLGKARSTHSPDRVRSDPNPWPPTYTVMTPRSAVSPRSAATWLLHDVASITSTATVNSCLTNTRRPHFEAPSVLFQSLAPLIRPFNARPPSMLPLQFLQARRYTTCSPAPAPARPSNPLKSPTARRCIDSTGTRRAEWRTGSCRGVARGPAQP